MRLPRLRPPAPEIDVGAVPPADSGSHVDLGALAAVSAIRIVAEIGAWIAPLTGQLSAAEQIRLTALLGKMLGR